MFMKVLNLLSEGLEILSLVLALPSAIMLDIAKLIKNNKELNYED